MFKIISIWFVLCIFKLTNGEEPPDLLLVSKPNNEHICIADGNVYDSGIGWIYPIADSQEKLPKIVSNFVPDIKNDYDCNFSEYKYCSPAWQMEDWQHSKFGTHDLKPTLDSRWDDYPLQYTSNTTKQFSVKTPIPPTFHIGLSVRTEKNAEVFLCETWNPQTSWCYYINIGGLDNKQAFLKKYNSVPDKMMKNDSKLSKYKSDVNITSEEEWKTFGIMLSDNGTLKVVDAFDNTVLINYTDNKPLKPIYLFVRSKYNKALWKMHNNRYTFTNKSRTTQLGPNFNLQGHTLCVSLYVSICKQCKITFFIIIDGENRILQELTNRENEENLLWKKIKLVYDNIYDDNLTLFVETKYVNNSVRNGFWAIDNVRMCTKNEIKVTRLFIPSTSPDLEKSSILCEALRYPKWRPLQHILSPTPAEVFNLTSAKPTSLRMTWKKPEETKDNFQRYYIVHYEGADTCIDNHTVLNPPRNKQRIKSQSFVITRSNNIVIKDLIPYTHYNITLLNLIEDNAESLTLNTLPTDIPTKNEIPRNINVKFGNINTTLQWDQAKCNETYGPVFYQINITSEDGRDNKSVKGVGNNHTFKSLIPFTNYKGEINIARKEQYFNDTKMIIKVLYNFTTLAAIAPKVENLELYAVSAKTARLRFNLAKHLRGVPTDVQIRQCHPLLQDTCTMAIRNLTKCPLWNDKYCLYVTNLTRGFNYSFLVSVKNNNTNAFGYEAQVSGKTQEGVPGPPLNVSYKMIECTETKNYCKLNITWLHPYYQNATITMFEIFLNETSFTMASDAEKTIHAVSIIDNENYQPEYSYSINFIPFNTPYTISIWSVNGLSKGLPATIKIKTKNIHDYIDQTPTYVNRTNETISFKLPQLDWRLQTSTLILIAQDYNKNVNALNDEIKKLRVFESNKKLCNKDGNSWIAGSINIFDNSTPIIVVGDNSTTYLPQLNKTVKNIPLKPNTEYCFTFVLMNKYKDNENLVIYHERNLFTEPNWTEFDYQKEDPHKIISPAAYLVPALLIILIGGFGAWFTYRYLRRRRYRRNDNSEHIYESMPFDDYMPGSFANRTYDKLIHD